jgi:hypothetical protein
MKADTTAPTTQGTGVTEFVPFEGGEETTSAELLLVIAYLVMWGLLLAFVGLGWRRQQRLEARLGDLERNVAGKASGA